MAGEEKWHHETPRLFKKRRCFFVVENIVYLVRHGESVANTKGIYQGQTYDTPLSQLGKKQADALGKRLKNELVTRIVASPLTRTRQTAEAIAVQTGVPFVTETKILETDHGQWEGKSVEEIEKRWPDALAVWRTAPSKADFPGGETYEDTRRRALAWWHDFLPTVRGRTVVVTHDNIVRAIVADMLDMPTDAIWKLELQPAAITTVAVQDGKPKVTGVNDTNHLEGLRANLAFHAL